MEFSISYRSANIFLRAQNKFLISKINKEDRVANKSYIFSGSQQGLSVPVEVNSTLLRTMNLNWNDRIEIPEMCRDYPSNMSLDPTLRSRSTRCAPVIILDQQHQKRACRNPEAVETGCATDQR